MSPPAEVRSDRDGAVAIIVLGMHRSGTSLVTGLLGKLGAALPRDAMDATAENRHGYFESIGVARAGERLLRTARSSWFDARPLGLDRVPSAALAGHREALGAAIDAAFGGAPLIALKDPRQCRFVPLVAAVLGERGYAARCVLVVRGADDVAASLAARDGTTPDYARLVWLRHMLDAERDSRGHDRAVIRYDAVLEDWRGAAAAIVPLLGGAGALPEAEIDALLDRDLRHHSGARLHDEFAALTALVRAAEAAFAALALDDGPVARGRLDAIAARLYAQPWIEGDASHDELRHRRVAAAEAGAPAVGQASAEPAPAPEPPAPTPSDAGDDDETIRTIRDSGLFDADYYLATYPDVAASGDDPIAHYVAVGAAEGRNPSALFNTGFYARQMMRRIRAGTA